MTTIRQVVTICGSMTLFSFMLTVAAEETLDGHIVLAPFAIVPADRQRSDVKSMLDELHLAKIDLAHRVIVVTDHLGRIGESTSREISYARTLGRVVQYRRASPPGQSRQDDWLSPGDRLWAVAAIHAVFAAELDPAGLRRVSVAMADAVGDAAKADIPGLRLDLPALIADAAKCLAGGVVTEWARVIERLVCLATGYRDVGDVGPATDALVSAARQVDQSGTARSGGAR